jgi:hypothetical protein
VTVVRSPGDEPGAIPDISAEEDSMRTIWLQWPPRALAAALVVAAFATCVQARDGSGPGSGAAAAAATGHSQMPLDQLNDQTYDRTVPPAAYSAISPGASPAGCGGGLELASPSPFGDPSDAVKALSRATQNYIARCECATQQCVADALDQYAEALAVVAPRLPPEFRNIPNVVKTAARRVRAARTKVEAAKILDEAIVDVNTRISYVRAEDPETQRLDTRSAGYVADTFNVASAELKKAAGL